MKKLLVIGGSLIVAAVLVVAGLVVYNQLQDAKDRTDYLSMAAQFDARAIDAQKQAEAKWKEMNMLNMRDPRRSDVAKQAQSYVNQAQEYRDTAIKYRQMAGD